MHYELTLGVPAIAVGLSAISFSAALQKDAAPIPDAGRLPMGIKQPLYKKRGQDGHKTGKPQLYAGASVMRVATTYFPTILMQYHRRCGA